MKVEVNQDICIGCGLCTNIAQNLFSMNDEGKAKAIDIEITDKDQLLAEESVNSCPVSAIKVISKN